MRNAGNLEIKAADGSRHLEINAVASGHGQALVKSDIQMMMELLSGQKKARSTQIILLQLLLGFSADFTMTNPLFILRYLQDGF